MGAARMGSGPLSRLNSPSKRACMERWLRDGLGAGLRGSRAWQAPGGGANARGRGERAGTDAPGVWSISSGGRDARQ